jgi:hypothetical protein
MTNPDLEKVWEETEELRNLPPVTIEISLLAAMEIVSYIQIATKDPARAEGEFGKMAIEVARKLQNFLDPNSECFKFLEFGWELQAEMREIDSCKHQSEVKVQELQERLFELFGPCLEAKPDEKA